MMWAPVLAVLLLACGTAWAAPATVNLRVEGATSTIFEGPVTTDGKVITMGGNTLVCDGTSNPGNPGPGPTAISALDDASIPGGWGVSSADFVNRIDGEASNATQFWGIALNRVPIDVGGCGQQVAAGDEVLFAFDFFQPDFSERPILSLDGPPKAQTGQPVGLAVDEVVLNAPFPAPREFVARPAAGVTVAGVATGADGSATATFPTAGLVRLKAERPGSIRSNAVLMCVSDTGTDDCGVPPGQLGTPVARSNVTDSSAPIARISGPRNGRKYRRGPRLLRGTARDEGSGVREVKLSIRRHARGKGCQWWSGRRDRFVGRNCRKTFFFAIGDDTNWSYLLPRRLGPGRYVVDVKVFDARRNRNNRFIPGENRAVFDVLGRSGGQNGRSAAAHARVEVMVVGKQGVITAPITVRAPKTVVRASGRRCAVAASTPLGALQAALRPKRVGFAVRDYGSCARRNTRSSGQLFVTKIARERNSGADGWVYKIDDLTPGTGAAEGRLRAGDRLLWLYCEQDSQTGGCQRSLRVVPAGKGGPAGGSLPVRVFGYDDKRTRRSVPGARLTLTKGSQEIVSAVSSLDGSAVLRLPPAGRYELAASADGLAPSFPVTVRTR
jgi:hypothetical protein